MSPDGVRGAAGPGPTAGLLLTGGEARRLGVPKSGLTYRGERLAARAKRVLESVCDGPVLEVGPGTSGLPAVREDPPGAGPLAALAAGGHALRARRHEGGVLLLAVDLPLVDEPLLRLLAGHAGADTVVPDAEGRLQVACARYGPDALRRAGELLAEGERSLRALVAAVAHDVLPEEEWRQVAPPGVFADVDTPADAAALGITLPPADAHG
jgi:molybdopterin-guanine dinucleotide biosynthesis protein A